MSEIVWSNIIFQLVFLAILVLIVIVIVSAVRTITKRSKQIDSIEKKIDEMNHQIKKDKGDYRS